MNTFVAYSKIMLPWIYQLSRSTINDCYDSYFFFAWHLKFGHPLYNAISS
jgi:hypothetical protein